MSLLESLRPGRSGQRAKIPACAACLAWLLLASVIAGCESDGKKLVRLRKQAETLCLGLQDMRRNLDSAFGYWMTMNPDTLMPVMAAYGDSLKYWYGECEVAIRDYNTFRGEVGASAGAMSMPAAP